MFGDKLKKARINRKLKQSELATLLGVRNTTVSNWEKGVSYPTIDIISKICSILNIDGNYLLDLNDAKVALKSLHLEDCEETLINNFRKLKDKDKKLITQILERMLEE